jgi:hypothetical protein
MVEHLEKTFPGLQSTQYRITSQPSNAYNCIAWAVNDDTRWWWPDAGDPSCFWPAGLPFDETLDTFVKAFAALGFKPIAQAESVEGFELIALFAKNGQPTHAARKLPNGLWTSKLGFQDDIEHELTAIEGDAYGQVALFLGRQLQ